MTLYIVRHGLTEENQQQILQGHLPGSLTEEGREQVRKAAERLQQSETKFSCIVCSDLKRAMDSAKILGERLGLKVKPMKLLRERDWGTYTGMSVNEAKERFYRDEKWNFPIAEHPVESEEAIMARAHKVLDELMGLYADENVIVVTHGMFARCVIAARFGCGFREVAPMVNAEVRILVAKK